MWICLILTGTGELGTEVNVSKKVSKILPYCMTVVRLKRGLISLEL